MIRRVSFALLICIPVLFPLGLASQADDSSHSAIGAESLGGCLAAASVDDQAGHGFDLANLDRSVSPCDDFFQFADGGWVKTHPIPAAHSALGEPSISSVTITKKFCIRFSRKRRRTRPPRPARICRRSAISSELHG